MCPANRFKIQGFLLITHNPANGMSPHSQFASDLLNRSSGVPGNLGEYSFRLRRYFKGHQDIPYRLNQSDIAYAVSVFMRCNAESASVDTPPPVLPPPTSCQRILIVAER